MVMPQGNYDLADLQGIAGVGADYAATYRYLQMAQQGQYMGLLTPNMIQLLGLTQADLLSMGYGALSSGSYIRYDPVSQSYTAAPTSGGGGGGGYGGMSSAARGAMVDGLINWRIGV
jgi:hypothetical protein